jgi:hypothetical protein
MPPANSPPDDPGFAVANKQSPVVPPQQLVSRFKDRRFLAGLCGLLVVSNIVTPWLVASALYRKQIVLVADSGGNIIIAPGLDFKEASKIHTTCGLLAAQALLQRGPAGFDMPDMVDNIFFRDGRKKAQDEIADALPALSSRSMHQKVEVSNIEVKSVRQTQGIQIYFIEVDGQIIRDGQISGARVREVDEVKLLFQMWQNPRLTENGRYPLVVADYKYLLLRPTGDRKPEAEASAAAGSTASIPAAPAPDQ